MDLATKQERVLTSGLFERPPIISDRPYAWSPDSKWIAYMPTGQNQFRNVHVVPVENGAGRPVSFLANVFSNSVTWSPDGTFILLIPGSARNRSNWRVSTYRRGRHVSAKINFAICSKKKRRGT